MDLLDFFEHACRHTQPGDMVSWPAGEVGLLRHADALAMRLGFKPQGSTGDVWLNARQPDSPVIRWAHKLDFAEWLDLFVACFGHDMSEAQWSWKYRDTNKPGVAVFQQGRMIAFYGGMPRDVFFGGQKRTGIQVGDVMVHPAFREGLTRKGPFQLAASTFLEQSLSVGAPCWIGFGFPNQRAMQVARRLHLYRPVDQLAELFWPPKIKALPWWLGCVQADRTHLEYVDDLWLEMRQAMPGSLMGVRDAQHVQTRYVAHPSHHYTVLKVFNRVSRKVLGVVVLRQLSDGRQEMLDVIGHPRRFRTLVLAAQSFASEANSPAVSAWITQSHAHLLQTDDSRLESLDVQIPTNDWVPGDLDIDPAGRWWLTSGDTDFR
jgi:hypothetical protein